MRFTLRLSPSLTSAGDPRFRLRFLLFDVRMCRRCDRPRFTFPVPVTLKRLAAPLCVFNFGIKSSENSRQLSAIGCQFHFILAECQMTAQARLVFQQLHILVIPTLSKAKGRNLLRPYDAGLATCAGGALSLGALCTAALCFSSFCFSFSRSFSVFFGARIA